MAMEHFRNITIQQMEALVALVEEGNFSRAARKMYLTQPALTKNIKNIENYLGLRIVNRSGGCVTLTAEGRIIYDYARKIVRLRNEAGEKIARLQGNDNAGDIYVGASTIPANYLLPRTLSLFKKQHQAIRVHVRTADSEEAINMVLSNEVEIGFVGKKPLNRKLIAEPLWHDRLILAISRNHAWHKRRSVSLEELIQEPFIVREKGSATRDILESYLKEHKLAGLDQFNICCQLGSSEAIKEAIIAGLGVSIISIYAVERELSSKLIMTVPLDGVTIGRNFYMIRGRQCDLKTFHRLFIDFIKASASPV